MGDVQTQRGAYTPVPAQHKEITLCQIIGVSKCPHTFGCPHMFRCSPVCFDALFMFGCPTCLDVWGNAYVWGNLNIWRCPNIQRHPNIWGYPNIWGHPKIQGHPNMGESKHMGPFKYTSGIPACLSFPQSEFCH